MHLTVTLMTAAVLTLWLVGQSVRVMLLRRRFKVSIGMSNEPLLQRAMRAQGNTAEYLPVVLILLALLEVHGAWPLGLAGLAGAFVLGRGIHAYALAVAEPRDQNFGPRVAAMVLTWTPLSCLALWALVMSLGGM